MHTRIAIGLLLVSLSACGKGTVVVGDGGVADLAGAPQDLAASPDLAGATGLVGSWTSMDFKNGAMPIEGTYDLTLSGGPTSGAAAITTRQPFSPSPGCFLIYIADGQWMALENGGKRYLVLTFASGTAETTGCMPGFVQPPMPLQKDGLNGLGSGYSGEYVVDAATLTVTRQDGARIIYERK